MKGRDATQAKQADKKRQRMNTATECLRLLSQAGRRRKVMNDGSAHLVIRFVQS